MAQSPLEGCGCVQDAEVEHPLPCAGQLACALLGLATQNRLYPVDVLLRPGTTELRALEVNAAYSRSLGRWARGRTGELVRGADEAAREADDIGHSLSRAYGRVVQGVPLLIAGAHDQARRSIRAGLELAAADGDQPVVVALGRLLEAAPRAFSSSRWSNSTSA